jgi:UDP-glucose 4-epimerase
MSVYGQNDAENVHEESICVPKSFYAVGKLASENYLSIYNKFGINSTALRLFNIYGPGQNMSNLKQGMLSIYLAQFLDSEEVIVKGSGDRYRDLIYIDDVIESIIRCLNNKNSHNQVINIGIGKKITVQYILNCISRTLHSPKNIKFVEGTPGDLHGITACTKKMDKILGKWDKVELEEGVGRMIDYLSQH